MSKAIIILAAGIKRLDNGQWVNTSLSPDDISWGAPGGNLRVIAAKYLFEQDPSQIIIASGGRGHDIRDDGPDRPDLADIIKTELISLNTPQDKIIKENKSNRTYEQLVEGLKIIKDKNFDDSIIVTSDYHIPRVQAMINSDKQLKEIFDNYNLKIVSAEAVAKERDPDKWQELIDDLYNHPEMKKLIAAEQKGVADINSGIYKFNKK